MLFKKSVQKVLLLLMFAQAAYAQQAWSKEFQCVTPLEKALTIPLPLHNPIKQLYNSANLHTAVEPGIQTAPQKNNISKNEMDDHQKINLLIWAFVAVFVISKVFLGRMIWLKSKLNKARLKAIQAEAALLAEQQEVERQKVESQKAMMEEKEREMVAIALKLANYNDRLQDIVALIEQKKITTTAEVKSEINKVIAQDDFWNYFDLRFTQLHPDFKIRLSNQYTDLSKSEIDFCCLLRLNLSNKEIGSLLSISYESVISKRYRIRKKMGLSEEDDLNVLLEKL